MGAIMGNMIELPKVLCVDDEPQVLEGISLHLRRKYQAVTAPSGEAGLRVLSEKGPFTAVLSDMRMPGMNGATFLSKVRQQAPDTVRMLLTGHSDIQSAIAAINEGQIFRFLSKPCPPEQLLKAFESAVEQYRLINAEHELLEQTLRGSIQTLIDILSMTNPIAFGKATRIKQNAMALADKMEIKERWPIEVAAMLSQLGTITLPEKTIEKHYYGLPLEEEERKQVERLPEVTKKLLANIPRLEPVKELLLTPHSRAASSHQPVPIGASLLRVATDYDELESRGMSPQLAIETMKKKTGTYEPEILDALLNIKETDKSRSVVREIPVHAIQLGMVFADEVKTTNGVMLVGRGYEVTAGFIERISNFKPGTIKEPVRVIEKSK
jgi:response regulator RpfG family c-di-GMP phosphodiesterase